MTMQGPPHAELRFDGRAPGLLADPYPAYAELRDAGGVCRGGIGQWVVSRHDDVSRLLRDPRLGKTMPESYVRFSTGDDEISSFAVRQNLGRRDRAASRLLARAFSGALIGRLGAPMRERADDLLQPVAERGHMDVVRDLALPFQAGVMCDLVGVPPGDWTEVWPRVRCLVDAFSDAFFVSAERSTEASAALRWLREYLGALLAGRRRVPGDDLVSRLLQADEEGRRLGDDEIVDNVITILYAGTETSMGMISNGVAALGLDPEQFATLRSDPRLVTGAVEELLRLEAPIQVTTRVVLEPVTVGGTKIRPGRVALLLLGSANHDGSQFQAPERLDVARDPNPHLSFGGGHYYCLGAALARAEGRAVLESLLARFRSIEVCGQPVRSRRYNFRSYASLEVAVEPARR
jgi:cytochrome P450